MKHYARFKIHHDYFRYQENLQVAILGGTTYHKRRPLLGSILVTLRDYS